MSSESEKPNSKNNNAGSPPPQSRFSAATAWRWVSLAFPLVCIALSWGQPSTALLYLGIVLMMGTLAYWAVQGDLVWGLQAILFWTFLAITDKMAGFAEPFKVVIFELLTIELAIFFVIFLFTVKKAIRFEASQLLPLLIPLAILVSLGFATDTSRSWESLRVAMCGVILFWIASTVCIRPTDVGRVAGSVVAAALISAVFRVGELFELWATSLAGVPESVLFASIGQGETGLVCFGVAAVYLATRVGILRERKSMVALLLLIILLIPFPRVVPPYSFTSGIVLLCAILLTALGIGKLKKISSGFGNPLLPIVAAAVVIGIGLALILVPHQGGAFSAGLFGKGAGNFPIIAGMETISLSDKGGIAGIIPPDVGHPLFWSRLLVETGWLGVAAWIIVWGVLLLMLFRHWSAEDDTQRVAKSGVALVLTVLLLMGLSRGNLISTVPVALIFTMGGLAVALRGSRSETTNTAVERKGALTRFVPVAAVGILGLWILPAAVMSFLSGVNYTQAITRRQAGNFDAALQRFQYCLNLNPSSAEARVGRASIWAEQGEYQAALQDLDEALSINPAFPEAHHLYAQVLAQQGIYDSRAVQHARKAAVISWAHPEPHRFLAEILDLQGKPEAAIFYLDSVADGLSDLQIYFKLAILNRDQEEYEKASEAFKNALDLSPDNPQVLLPFGVMLLEHLNDDMGILSLERGFAILQSQGLQPPTEFLTEAYPLMTEFALAEGSLTLASKYCTELSGIAPTSPVVKELALEIDNAWRADPSKVKEDELSVFHRNQGIPLFEAGYRNQAREHFEEVLRIEAPRRESPDSDPRLLRDAYFYVGFILYLDRELEQAYNYFNIADEIQPGNYYTLLRLGTVAYELGRYGIALDAFQKAYKVESSDPTLPPDPNLPGMIDQLRKTLSG